MKAFEAHVDLLQVAHERDEEFETWGHGYLPQQHGRRHEGEVKVDVLYVEILEIHACLDPISRVAQVVRPLQLIEHDLKLFDIALHLIVHLIGRAEWRLPSFGDERYVLHPLVELVAEHPVEADVEGLDPQVESLAVD